MPGEKLSPRQAKWVEKNVDLVKRIAGKVRRQMGEGLGADLESAGYEAMVRAALRYDPECGVPFTAFAHYRVRGAMIDAIRKSNPTLRRHRRALKQLETSQSILEQAERAQPDARTRDTRTLRERVEAAAALVKQTTAAVAMSRATAREPDSIPAGGARTDETATAAERVHLRSALEHADERDRELVSALYFEGLTMAEYAERTQVAVSTISRRHARTLAKLAAAMGADPPDSG